MTILRTCIFYMRFRRLLHKHCVYIRHDCCGRCALTTHTEPSDCCVCCIDRCPPSKHWIEIAMDLKELSFHMKNYRCDKDYMFRVRASNEYGISEPSMSATLFAKPGTQPTGHTALKGNWHSANIGVTYSRLQPTLLKYVSV